MTMQMSTKDVETVYDFCRKLAPLLRQGMDILTGQILDYQKTGDVASLKPVLFNFYDDLGISVPRYQQIEAATDWRIIECAADRDETGFKCSVARRVLRFPTDVRELIRFAIESIGESDFDAQLLLLYAVAIQGRFDDIVRDDLFAEEGRTLLAMKKLGTDSEIPIVEFSPWIDSPEMIALMKFNGHNSTGDKTIQRYKQKWKAESQPDTNHQKFRFHLPTLKDLGINPLPDWPK